MKDSRGITVPIGPRRVADSPVARITPPAALAEQPAAPPAASSAPRPGPAPRPAPVADYAERAAAGAARRPSPPPAPRPYYSEEAAAGAARRPQPAPQPAPRQPRVEMSADQLNGIEQDRLANHRSVEDTYRPGLATGYRHGGTVKGAPRARTNMSGRRLFGQD